jgi:hypothetical protein
MHADEFNLPIYQVYANEIIQSFAQEMEKEFKLDFAGEGGKMPYNVEEIEIYFNAYRRATIEEARELEVTATERLLKKINEHESIRPFLKEYPFKAISAKVRISYRKLDDSCHKDGSVVLVLNSKNRLHYFRENALTGRFTPLLDEPYEEARQIVEENSKMKIIHQCENANKKTRKKWGFFSRKNS